MCDAYGEACFCQKIFTNKLFKEDRNSIQSEDRPKTGNSPEMVDLFNAHVLADRRVKMEDISKQPLWVQQRKLYIIILPFLRSVVGLPKC